MALKTPGGSLCILDVIDYLGGTCSYNFGCTMVYRKIKKPLSTTITRVIIGTVMIACTACHSGLIPCPRVKTVRMRNQPHRYFYESQETLSADAKTNVHGRSAKTDDGRSVKNVSVEEWDCPRPGVKKYMPRNVKENIKRNMEKMTSSSDSTRTSK